MSENGQFWKRQSLDQLTGAQWEALCDGCGQCCLIKLIDEETGELAYTRLACRLLDLGHCRCADYANRHKKIADCIRLTPDTIGDVHWLPATCAYRLIAEGRDLAWWHPLVSGDPGSVHAAGVSVRDWAVSETQAEEDDFEAFIVDEPGPLR